ncbi:hypothetical protein GWI33_019924, partial [Rhynchophorus ferrugineus]
MRDQTRTEIRVSSLHCVGVSTPERESNARTLSWTASNQRICRSTYGSILAGGETATATDLHNEPLPVSDLVDTVKLRQKIAKTSSSEFLSNVSMITTRSLSASPRFCVNSSDRNLNKMDFLRKRLFLHTVTFVLFVTLADASNI